MFIPMFMPMLRLLIAMAIEMLPLGPPAGLLLIRGESVLKFIMDEGIVGEEDGGEDNERVIEFKPEGEEDKVTEGEGEGDDESWFWFWFWF